MLTIVLDDEEEAAVVRYAAETGREPLEIVRAWMGELLERVAMVRRIENFASLSEDERSALQAWAWDRATDAQMLAMDSEDGGYNWGPHGPPRFDDRQPGTASSHGRPATISG